MKTFENLAPTLFDEMELPLMLSVAASRVRTLAKPIRWAGDWTAKGSGLWREYARLIGEIRPKFVDPW